MNISNLRWVTVRKKNLLIPFIGLMQPKEYPSNTISETPSGWRIDDICLLIGVTGCFFMPILWRGSITIATCSGVISIISSSFWLPDFLNLFSHHFLTLVFVSFQNINALSLSVGPKPTFLLFFSCWLCSYSCIFCLRTPSSKFSRRIAMNKLSRIFYPIIIKSIMKTVAAPAPTVR